MSDEHLYSELASELSRFDFPIASDCLTIEKLKIEISREVNHLISTDFSRLISLLYRLDISEKKLRNALAAPKVENAGDVIAEMIISRQLEKIKSRNSFKTAGHDIPEEEKW
jgi:hypothetical protein